LDRALKTSIVVCSNGRRDGLAALFDSFARLALPETGAAEVILVDNTPVGALRPFAIFTRQPWAALEVTRALHRSVLFLLGALRYRVLGAWRP